jgi:putative ABC transport system permease protein
MNDLRYAVRQLLKSPGFTIVAVLTLALGIGANSAIFSVVNAVLLRPLPLSNPDQLIQLLESKDFPAGFQGSVSAPNFVDWQEQNTVFSGIASYRYQDFALQTKQNPERLLGVSVTPNYFRVLGASALLGRTFNDNEPQADVAVLSEGLWRAQFAADPAVIGRPVSLNGRSFTVIGVMPANVRFPSPRNQLWTQLIFSPAELSPAARGDHGLQVIGRLKPGVSVTQALAQMKVVAQGLAQKFSDEQAGRSVKLVPLREQLTADSRTSLLVLLGSVACVLLIASANIANLLLARTAGRQREIALRLALGASRVRLIRQFLTESVLLPALGGAAGIVTSIWATNLLVAWLGNRIGVGEVRLDATVLGFTAVLALLVGLGCGLAPARQAIGRTADDLQTALHGHTAVAGANRLRGILVVAEMALAVVLLSGAGLLLRSFAQLQRTDSGLAKPEQVLTARVTLPAERYAALPSVADFYDRALARIDTLPGVRSAGAISYLPLANWGWNGNLHLVGRNPFPAGQEPLAEFRVVGGNYFATMGVPLLAGRLLDKRDGPDAPLAVVVNRALALRIGKTEGDALTDKISIGPDRNFSIVGVVADVRQSGLDRPPMPEIYFPVGQAPGSEGLGASMAQSMTLVVRAAADDPNGLTESVRRAVREIDPGLPLFRIQTLQTVIAQSVADRRLNGVLLGSFAALAVGLAALGLYGVLSYAVAQRTRELGIRLALGAQKSALFRLVVGGGMKLAAMGAAIGLIAALGLSRFLTSLLYGVAPSDPYTFAGVIVLLGVVAFLANYVPARRATQVDPMVALRYE